MEILEYMLEAIAFFGKNLSIGGIVEFIGGDYPKTANWMIGIISIAGLLQLSWAYFQSFKILEPTLEKIDKFFEAFTAKITAIKVINATFFKIAGFIILMTAFQQVTIKAGKSIDKITETYIEKLSSSKNNKS